MTWSGHSGVGELELSIIRRRPPSRSDMSNVAVIVDNNVSVWVARQSPGRNCEQERMLQRGRRGHVESAQVSHSRRLFVKDSLGCESGRFFFDSEISRFRP